MINHTYKTKKFLEYTLRARGRFGIHSPFIYEFTDKVLNDKRFYDEYRTIEDLRRRLLHSGMILSQDDFGAGNEGNISFSGTRTVRRIIHHSTIHRKYGRLLFRISHYYKPETILELGTSLGFGSMYLGAGNPESTVYTVEGCQETADRAQENFREAGINNIHCLTGKFDEVLPGFLKGLDEPPGLVFIDGNHRYQSTVSYFEQLLPFMDEGILILDDIYWSQEMEKAWNRIKSCPEVTATVDLFRMGIVFFRKGLFRQDFVIRF